MRNETRAGSAFWPLWLPVNGACSLYRMRHAGGETGEFSLTPSLITSCSLTIFHHVTGECRFVSGRPSVTFHQAWTLSHTPFKKLINQNYSISRAFHPI